MKIKKCVQKSEINWPTNKNLRDLFEFAENAEKKIWIKLLNDKYFYENFNLNFSLQNKQLQVLNKWMKIEFSPLI